MLANAEMQITTAGVLRTEVAGTFERQPGLAGWCEVCRTTHQPGNIFGEGVQDQAGCLAGRLALGIGREIWQILVPPFGKLALLHPEQAIAELRVLLAVLLKER